MEKSFYNGLQKVANQYESDIKKVIFTKTTKGEFFSSIEIGETKKEISKFREEIEACFEKKVHIFSFRHINSSRGVSFSFLIQSTPRAKVLNPEDIIERKIIVNKGA